MPLFQQFVGLEVGSGRVPDESTIRCQTRGQRIPPERTTLLRHMYLRYSLRCVLAFVLSACGWHRLLEPATLSALYAQSLTPSDKPLRVFHIGHSRVG